MSCLIVLKLLWFPWKVEEKGGSCSVQMEIQLAKTGTTLGTAVSCHGSLSALPLQQVVAPSQQPCSDRAVVWCQHRAPLGFLRQLLSAEGLWGCSQAPHPCALERDASLLQLQKLWPPGTCRNHCGICWFCQTQPKHWFPSGVSHQDSCWLWKTCSGFHL